MACGPGGTLAAMRAKAGVAAVMARGWLDRQLGWESMIGRTGGGTSRLGGEIVQLPGAPMAVAFGAELCQEKFPSSRSTM